MTSPPPGPPPSRPPGPPAGLTETLVRRWHEGWRVSRGLPEAEELDGSLRTVVGTPGRGVETLVLGADHDPRRVDRAAAAALADRDPWVSVPTQDPGRMADRLQEHGLSTAVVPEWLMSSPLGAQRRAPLPDGYIARLQWRDDRVAHLRVLAPDGGLAASGQLGLAGTVGVPDKIETVPAHRRRGLGGAVMTALADAALERGVSEGVLVASQAGRGLYRGLGWEQVGAVVIGRLL